MTEVCNKSLVLVMVESLSCFLAAHATTPAYPLFLSNFSSLVLYVNVLRRSNVTTGALEEKTPMYCRDKISLLRARGWVG